MTGLTRSGIRQAYLEACEVELQAFKPGNVSVYADGHDMTVEDFRISAKVSADPISNPDYTLGEKIYYAVSATRKAVACNTNLGILLLCAPMLQAAALQKEKQSLREALSEVLETTTIVDAEMVFRAITLAAPGGLGNEEEHDVRERPQITLTRAMELASEKDRIALQYKSNFKDIFDFSVMCYNTRLDRWGNKDWAAASTYVEMLCRFPDSHIERKYGDKYTGMVASKMAIISRELSDTDNPQELEGLFYSIDAEFKFAGINPGTMADMTVATVLASSLLEKAG